METIDYKKQFKQFYAASAVKVEIVDVPAMNFLMIDGCGDPNTAKSFGDAIEALYSLAYTLKFMVKKGPLAIDYGVLPLEGLWWAEDMTAFTTGNKDAWNWTVMIMQPEFITPEMVAAATLEVAKKKSPVALPLVRFARFAEGKAAQTLHVGPFAEEGPTMERVHARIAALRCQRVGKHHEIYLSDMRRTAPEKWRTIVRQPLGQAPGQDG